MSELAQLAQALFGLLLALINLAVSCEMSLRATMGQEGIGPSAQGVILISTDLVVFCCCAYLLRGWLRAATVFITLMILIHLLQLWSQLPEGQ